MIKEDQKVEFKWRPLGKGGRCEFRDCLRPATYYIVWGNFGEWMGAIDLCEEHFVQVAYRSMRAFHQRYAGKIEMVNED